MQFIFFYGNQQKQNLKIFLDESKTFYYSVLLIILSSTVFSQTLIKGSIKSNENESIQNVSVVLINENEDLLDYTSTNKNGFFSFEVYDQTRKFLVFRALGY